MKYTQSILTLYKKHFSLLRNLFFLALISLLTNLLTDSDNFDTGDDSFDFPWISTITSIIIGIVIGFIAEQNFKYYKKKHFSISVSFQNIVKFVISTLVFVAFSYLPFYGLAIWIAGASFTFYYFLVGLLITLLLTSLAIILLYAEKVYKLHKLEVLDTKLSVSRNGTTRIIEHTDIAYFYSEEKVVYLVKTNGVSVSTSYTLQQLEQELPPLIFFRANRQFLLRANAIDDITNISNGKLAVTITPKIPVKNKEQLIISRYKKQEFLAWFQNKLVST